jgi:hypothetical protein
MKLGDMINYEVHCVKESKRCKLRQTPIAEEILLDEQVLTSNIIKLRASLLFAWNFEVFSFVFPFHRALGSNQPGETWDLCAENLCHALTRPKAKSGNTRGSRTATPAILASSITSLTGLTGPNNQVKLIWMGLLPWRQRPVEIRSNIKERREDRVPMQLSMAVE